MLGGWGRRRNGIGLAGLFAAVLALGACGSNRIEVERIVALPADAPAATYVVVRAKAQDHAKDYPKYADQIAAQLAAKGFTRVEAARQAKYALMFSYDGDGSGGGMGSMDVYRHDKKPEGKVEHTVSIALFDLSRPDRPDEKVFGGRASCKVETPHVDIVIASLIEAVLIDFPGKARETYTVKLPPLE